MNAFEFEIFCEMQNNCDSQLLISYKLRYSVLICIIGFVSQCNVYVYWDAKLLKTAIESI